MQKNPEYFKAHVQEEVKKNNDDLKLHVKGEVKKSHDDLKAHVDESWRQLLTTSTNPPKSKLVRSQVSNVHSSNRRRPSQHSQNSLKTMEQQKLHTCSRPKPMTVWLGNSHLIPELLPCTRRTLRKDEQAFQAHRSCQHRQPRGLVSKLHEQSSSSPTSLNTKREQLPWTTTRLTTRSRGHQLIKFWPVIT